MLPGLGLVGCHRAIGSVSYYDFDALGSTAGISDAAGVYANRYAYLPFGESLVANETISNAFEFVGQWGLTNEGSGLDFMRARYYDQSDGRFVNPDPMGQIRGGLNLYGYSAVDPLPAEVTTTDFTVSWSGQDDPGGSGIASYDIYISDNGAEYTLWLDDTANTSALFTGQAGHTYAFYSIAHDLVGHEETGPPAPDATTTINIPNAVPTVAADTATIAVPESNPVENAGVFNDDDLDDVVAVTASIGTIVQIGTQTGTWTWTYVPTDGPTDSQTVIIMAADSQGASAQTSFDLTVDNVAPVVDAGADAVAEEGAVFVGSGTFIDPGTDTWTASVDYGAGIQPLALAGATFALDHTYLDDGTYAVTVVVTDDDGGVGSDTLTVSVNNVAPTADAGGPYTIDEGEDLALSGSGSDPSPVDNAILGYEWDLNGDGVFGDASGAALVVPRADLVLLGLGSDGVYTVTLRVSDDDTFTDDSTTLTINRVNTAPVADDDGYAADEDVVLTVAAPGVLDNDTDNDGDALEAVLVTEPAHGTVSLDTDGSFSYTPDQDYFGLDRFTYRASDGQVGGNEATVTISVRPVNDAPVAVDDTFSVDEDTVLNVVAPGVLGNDGDVDGDVLTMVLGSGDDSAVFQTFILEGLALQFLPEALEIWVDGVRWSVVESLEGRSGQERVYIVRVDEEGRSTVQFGDGERGSRLPTGESNVVATYRQGAGHERDGLRASVASLPSHGILVLDPDGSFAYTPEPNYHGVDRFAYAISDGSADSNTATVTITVNPVNDTPVAYDDSAATDEDVPVTISVLVNDTDVDNDTLTVSGVSVPTHGTAVVNGDGTVTYTPAQDFHGTDSFTYTASDGHGGSDTATVTVTVSALNDAPALGAIGNQTVDEGDALTFTATATDADISVQTLTFSLDAGAPAGAAIDPATGVFTWTPTEAQGPRIYDVTVRVTDDGVPVLSDIETITIAVNEVNAAPALGVIGDKSGDEGQLLSFTAGATDSDLPANGLTFSLLNAPVGASIDPATGVFTWTPSEGQGPAAYHLTVRVTDDGTPNLYDEETITVTITTQNSPPVANAGPDQSVFVTSTVSLNGNGSSDVDGDALTYSWSLISRPAGSTAMLSNPSAVAPTFVADRAGTYVAQLIVNDGTADGAPDAVTITSLGSTPVPAAVDSQVSVSLGLASYDRRTLQTKMQMTIMNTLSTPIYGPVWIVIKGISDPSVTLVGSSGTTSDGYLYIDVTSLLGDGRLDPGEKITTWLSFSNPLRRQFSFTYSIRGLLSPLLGP